MPPGADEVAGHDSGFTTVQRQRAYQGIVSQVEDAVRSRRLRPGDRLPSEREMMQQFSVSRPTVREALRVLEHSGLVSSRPGDPRGPVLNDFVPTALHRPIARIVDLESIDRMELLQFRIPLEATACRLAARARTTDQLAEIDARAADLRQVAGADAGSFGAAVTAFHAAIRRAGGNRLLQACGAAVDSAMSKVIDARLHHDPGRHDRLGRSAARSTAVVTAIADRDADGAARQVVAGILEYYQGSLTEAERAELARLVPGCDDDPTGPAA